MSISNGPLGGHVDSACTLCTNFLEKHPTAWLFAHSLVAVTGGILVWIGLWDLLDQHLWQTSGIGREFVYLIFGFAFLCITNTFLSVAGIAKPQPTPGDLTSSSIETDKQDHLLWTSIGSDEEAGMEEEEEDEVDEKSADEQKQAAIYNQDGTLFDPAVSPTHAINNRNTMASRPCSQEVVVYVYLRSTFALLGCVFYWIALYNIWDSHVFSSEFHTWRDIIYMILGILVLLATDTFLGESGLEHQQQVITRQQLEVKPENGETTISTSGPLSRAHVMIGIPYIPSLYTIYKSHKSAQYSALATSMEWKTVAWLYGKAALAIQGSVWYWIGAWNIIHQIIPDGIGREILFIIIGVLLFIVTNMMALAAGVQTAQQQEVIYQEIVARYQSEQRARQQHNSGLRGVSTQRVNVYEPNSTPPPSIDPDVVARIMIDEDVRPSSSDIDPYTGKCTRPIKLLYVRCGLAMLGGMLYWIGWYNSLMYEVNESSSDVDKAADFWRALMYVIVGILILIVTNTLFSFTGAISPHQLVKNDVQTRYYHKRRIALNNRLIMINRKAANKRRLSQEQQHEQQQRDRLQEIDEKHGTPIITQAQVTSTSPQTETAQSVSSFIGDSTSTNTTSEPTQSFVTIPLDASSVPSSAVATASPTAFPTSSPPVATSTSQSTHDMD